MEAKKTPYESAEYDRTFIERIAQMDYEELLVYLHGLPEEERKAMESAIYKAASQQAVQDHMTYLAGGLSR